MLKIEKIESIEELRELKLAYLGQTTAPLDGMWLSGFLPMSAHYGFYEDETLLGYCCVNEEGYLLQFYVSSGQKASSCFEAVLAEDSPAGQIHGAFVSTAEPGYLSLCLDYFPKFEVNALMYQLEERRAAEHGFELELVQEGQLDDLVHFAHQAIGAPIEWLSGYFENLIRRGELYCLRKDGRVVASGECRGNDLFQAEYADVGMIVAESERGKGMAAQMLKKLVEIAAARGLKAICSTEKGNIGAQKAIRRAGFVSKNRIVQFSK